MTELVSYFTNDLVFNLKSVAWKLFSYHEIRVG